MEPMVYYCLHKSPALVPILNHMNAVHTLTLDFLKIHFSIILPSDLFPSGSLTKILYAFLFSPMHATCTAHLILDFITLMICGEEYDL
jgi:hypothetical protein